MESCIPKILVVDDNPAIHGDFSKVLVGESRPTDFDALGSALFGDTPESESSFSIDSAFQGEQAIQMVRDAMAIHNPYRLAFVDVRIPPGIDGVQTIQQLVKIDPHLQCVICTAYSDYTPESARQKIGITDGLLFISKPFDPAIIRQLAKNMLDRCALPIAKY
jgi:two-component system, NtrC family, sensor kinase